MSRRRIAAAMISLLAAGGLLAIPSATSAASNGPSKSSNSQSEKSDKEKKEKEEKEKKEKEPRCDPQPDHGNGPKDGKGKKCASQ